MGLLPAGLSLTKGSIDFDGDRLSSLNDRQLQSIRGRRIAMIFKEPMTSLNPLKKIGRQIMEPILVHRLAGKRESRERALDLMAKVGIPSPSKSFDKYPHELSGGQQQRVMIAMAYRVILNF